MKSSHGAELLNASSDAEANSRTGGTDWCKLCIVGLLLLLGIEEAMLLL